MYEERLKYETYLSNNMRKVRSKYEINFLPIVISYLLLARIKSEVIC